MRDNRTKHRICVIDMTHHHNDPSPYPHDFFVWLIHRNSENQTTLDVNLDCSRRTLARITALAYKVMQRSPGKLFPLFQTIDKGVSVEYSDRDFTLHVTRSKSTTFSLGDPTT